MRKKKLCDFSLKIWVIVVVLFATDPFTICASENKEGLYVSEETQKNRENIEVLEGYLRETVPGLTISYREVFDIFIAEGHDIYVKGGVIRDILSLNPKSPHDVDFHFSGTKQEIVEIAEKYKWQYMTKPESVIIAIGDHNSIFMEGSEKNAFLPTNEHQLEFTINNIFYHVNSRTFLNFNSEVADDLECNRLRIIAKDWRSWLYGNLGGYRYSRLFRVWKMIGKGCIYQISFEKFIREETLKAQREDGETFKEEILNYLSNHYLDSFDDISRGCLVVMGQEWYDQFIEPLKDEIKRESLAIHNELKNYMHYSKQ